MPSCTNSLVLGDPIHLRLIGPLELTGAPSDNPPSLPKGRAVLLFALLAVHRNRVVSKDTIIETLWPDRAPLTATQTVASLVSRLRKVLGTCLERAGSGYRLNTTGWQVDVDEAARLTRAAERHLSAGEPAFADVAARRALGLLGAGRAVEEFQPAGWSADLDRTLQSLLRRAREAAWRAAEHLHDHRQAANLASAAAHDDPYDEPAWRALMAAQYRLGSAGAALHTFSRLRRTLRTDLGTDPDPRTEALHGAILQGRPTPTPAHPRPAAPADAPHQHLTGRDEELDQLQAGWRQALAGHPTTVVVRGGAGAGTSALLSALRGHVHHHGATVLAARCPGPERLLETPVLEQAIEDFCRTARPEEVTHAADGIADRLQAVIPHTDALTGPARQGDEHARFPAYGHTDAAAIFVRRLSTDHPVLLAVDDAHCADARTLETLHHLSQDAAGQRIMVVLGTREDGADRIARHLPHSTQLPLEPLGTHTVAELAARHDVPQAAQRVHQLTAGRPALVLAALKAAREGAPLDDPDHLPDTLINAAHDLVHHVGEPMTHLLRTAALIGATFRFEQLLKAAGTDGWRTAQQVEQALRVGLLTADGDALTFVGELLHIALYRAVPAPLRAGLTAYVRSR
ncbi:BTAD domain-containing putative transcriptional regulator [Streptomyces krungchingensis]|uniref:BTAD domain-containing putative transcriptional regulator n=1 Tax=Streptomyces krungchingensis TaxID=1565034 RepID=UPI003CF89C29